MMDTKYPRPVPKGRDDDFNARDCMNPLGRAF